jgi:hypothetical protein
MNKSSLISALLISAAFSVVAAEPVSMTEAQMSQIVAGSLANTLAQGQDTAEMASNAIYGDASNKYKKSTSGYDAVTMNPATSNNYPGFGADTASYVKGR